LYRFVADDARISAPRLTCILEGRIAHFSGAGRMKRQIGGMGRAHAIPYSDNELVFAIDRHAVAVPRGDREIGAANIRRDLPELRVERLVHLLAVGDVGNDPGESADQCEEAEEPGE